MVPVRRYARHWITYVVCGGMGLILTSGLALAGQSDQSKVNPHQERTDGHQNPPPPITPGTGQPSTKVQQNGCDRRQASEQSEHCFEWESAEAAQKQASVAEQSLLSERVGIVFVVFTFIATACAAIATACAAYSAKRATDLATRALTDLERPHLFIEISPMIPVQMELNTPYPKVEFSFANFGRFPADITRCSVDTYNSDSSIKPEIGPNRDFLCFVVGVGQTWSKLQVFFPNDKVGCRYLADSNENNDCFIPVRGEFTTFCRIQACYRGASDTIHVSDVTWKWDHVPTRWVLVQKERT